MDTKPWYTSRTLWVNLIAGIAAVSGAFGLDLGLTTEVQTALVGGVLAIANIALRVVTDKGLSS